MGTLHYSTESYGFEDRLLAHLQIVIVQKLRRHESFLMSWPISQEFGSGRASIWLDSGIPLAFAFAGTRAAQLNRDWVLLLAASADTGSGLIVIEEPTFSALRPGTS